MAKILIVHGIANQFVGERELLKGWHPALADGLSLAGFSSLPKRIARVLSMVTYSARPMRSALPMIKNLTTEITKDRSWRIYCKRVGSGEGRRARGGPFDPGLQKGLFRAPRFAELALNSLARSRYLADYLPFEFLGDLKQVALYLDDRELRRTILTRVLDRIGPETRVVIGHSLGSVITYEALCEKPAQVTAFITLGHPWVYRTRSSTSSLQLRTQAGWGTGRAPSSSGAT